MGYLDDVGLARVWGKIKTKIDSVTNTHYDGTVLFDGTAKNAGSYTMSDSIRNYNFIEISGFNSVNGNMPWSIKLRVNKITDNYGYVITHSRELFVTQFRISFSGNVFKVIDNFRMQVQSGSTSTYAQEEIYSIIGYANNANSGIGYSKLPDGTMMQWGMVRENIVTNAYKNAVKNIAFPYLFAVGCPVTVTIQNENNTYSMITLVDSVDRGSCRAILQGAAAANTSTATWFRWFAIGRWK